MNNKKNKNVKTNEEFLKDFQEFQDNFLYENDQWLSEVSTMISSAASPQMSMVKQSSKLRNPIKENVIQTLNINKREKSKKKNNDKELNDLTEKETKQQKIERIKKEKQEEERAVGPSQYFINYDLTLQRTKGGSSAFGMERDKFLKKTQNKKDSDSPGPSQYHIKHNLTESQIKGGSSSFSKDKIKFENQNFQKQEKEKERLNDLKEQISSPVTNLEKQIGKQKSTVNSDLPLIPKYDLVRPNKQKGCTIYKQPVEKKKLELVKKREEDMYLQNLELQKLREKSEKINPNSKGIKKNKFGDGCNISIAPPNRTRLTERQLELLISHLLQKNAHLLKHRVYRENNPQYTLVESRVPGPKIKQGNNFSRTKNQVEFEKLMRPGPQTYNQDDRKLHEKLRDQNFGKLTEQREFQKFKVGDYKELLLPNVDLVKPRAPQAVINKEHIMTDYEIDKLYEKLMGPNPQTFKPVYKLTEKRDDIGVVKYQEESTDVSDNNSSKKEKIDERVPLYPKYESILPNHMTFKYYEPSKDIAPQHTPDKVKNPGRWKFYDVDLNAVKELISTNIYLGGGKDLDKDKFQEHEDFLNILHTYLEKVNNKKPEVGQYEPVKPEKHVADIKFEKMVSRDKLELDSDYEQMNEGDILILDPTLPKDHIPGIDFGKQFGRGTDNTEFDEEQDLLDINPNLDFIKKRKAIGGAISLDKQVGRPIEIDLSDDEDFVAVGYHPTIPNDPMKPKVIVPIFDKQGERFKYEPDDHHKDELLIPSDYKPIDREKVLFKMDKAQDRFSPIKEKLNLDLEILDKKGEFLGTDLADVEKAFKATLPHQKVVDFNHFQSLAKFRIDLPKSKYGDNKEKEIEEN